MLLLKDKLNLSCYIYGTKELLAIMQMYIPVIITLLFIISIAVIVVMAIIIILTENVPQFPSKENWEAFLTNC